MCACVCSTLLCKFCKRSRYECPVNKIHVTNGNICASYMLAAGIAWSIDSYMSEHYSKLVCVYVYTYVCTMWPCYDTYMLVCIMSNNL